MPRRTVRRLRAEPGCSLSIDDADQGVATCSGRDPALEQAGDQRSQARREQGDVPVRPYRQVASITVVVTDQCRAGASLPAEDQSAGGAGFRGTADPAAVARLARRRFGRRVGMQVDDPVDHVGGGARHRKSDGLHGRNETQSSASSSSMTFSGGRPMTARSPRTTIGRSINTG